MNYRRYRVNAKDRAPLLAFMQQALERCGCTLLKCSPPTEAPFRLSFEAPDGERMGIIAYAFLANSRQTRNRPTDEHRFQLKYGSKDATLHEIWQDPFQLYTTILVGINPEEGFFVGIDPVLHNPTRSFISIEFKCKNVLRARLAGGAIRLDFQRTRGSKDDPCTRFYKPDDFDVVAACLHPCTEEWEFQFASTGSLDAHKRCAGRLSNLVRLDERWSADALRTFANVLRH